MSTASEQATRPDQNFLLAAMPADARERWAAELDEVELKVGFGVNEAVRSLSDVLFPTTAVISLVSVTQDGDMAETSVVGNDGIVGLPLVMGGMEMNTLPVVQVAGQAFRVPARLVRSEIRRQGAVLDILLRYSGSMLAQASQMALCNRYHSIDQQLARRMLVALERSASNEVMMTHESMANLMGVRREGITAAAVKLRAAGAIRYHRGRIEVLDRQRLEDAACECYTAGRGHPASN